MNNLKELNWAEVSSYLPKIEPYRLMWLNDTYYMAIISYFRCTDKMKRNGTQKQISLPVLIGNYSELLKYCDQMG